MRVTLTDDARRRIALFEEVTGATAKDCLVSEPATDDDDDSSGDDAVSGGDGRDGGFEANGRGGRDTGGDADVGATEADRSRVVFLVKAGEMGEAIGPDGHTVRQVEEKLGADVTLVENANTAEAFVASALAPAAVYNVTISENDSTVAYAEVDPADTGVAIGRNGRTIEAARRLAKRHFDIDDVQLA